MDSALAEQLEEDLLAECDEELFCPATMHVEGCQLAKFPEDLSPELNRPEVGGRVFLIGDSDLRDDSVLDKLTGSFEHGHGLVSWPDETRPGGRAGQVFDARYMTNSPRVAMATTRTLRELGWHVR
jgi:hypothetical protein